MSAHLPADTGVSGPAIASCSTPPAAWVSGSSARVTNVENDDTRAPTLQAPEPPASATLGRVLAPLSSEERRVGSVLAGRWKLERVIGVGGAATVYAARHRNGSRVAIKILHRQHTAVDAVRGRFLFEAFVANWISHPGTVLVHDEGIAEDGSVFLVMELLEGESLAEKIARSGGGLPLETVVPIVDQLLDVLAAVHESGIVHRDVKPDNVFITHDGRVKLLDFGVAHVRAWSLYRPTLPGATVGTPCYMPPEQALGSMDIDHRADLWAVGATMFTALTGKPVHEANDVFGELALTVSLPARCVRSVEPAIPQLMAGVVDRALAKDPAQRWPNARAMRCALREARERECSNAHVPASGALVQHRSLRAAVVALAGTVLAVGALGLAVRSPEPAPLQAAMEALAPLPGPAASSPMPASLAVMAGEPEQAPEPSVEASVLPDPSVQAAISRIESTPLADETASIDGKRPMRQVGAAPARPVRRPADAKSPTSRSPHSSRFWSAARDPLERRK